MDKGDDSDQFHHLRNLHKLSHKISKPTRQPPPHAPPPDPHALSHAPPPPPQQQQQQPPVYNINKNDFREVVQKLTGSPAHDRIAPPPPPPKPGHNSRLHRIRPPPLAQISPRPPPMLTCAAPQNPPPAAAASRPPPMSPLPPFPTVHAAAESPISAYMRFLQSSSTALPLPPQSPLAFGCLPSPLFSPSGLSGFPVSPVPSPGRRQTQV